LKKKLNVLFVLPKFDTSTEYGYYFFHYFNIERVASYYYNVIKLEKERALNVYVLQAIKKYDPVLVFGYGHGAWNLYTSQNKTPTFADPTGVAKEIPQLRVIVKKGNSEVLSDRIVYLLTCNVGRGLGKVAVSKGCRAFISFRDDFVWCSEGRYPLEDDISYYFFKPAYQVLRKILEGYTVYDAFMSFKYESLNYFEELDETARKTLLFNIKNMVLIGDRYAKMGYS